MSQPFEAPRSALFEALWQAQAGCCALCGEAMPRQRFELAHARLWTRLRPTVDHVRARARGGSDAPENLQLVHAACNRLKGRGPARPAR